MVCVLQTHFLRTISHESSELWVISRVIDPCLEDFG